MKKIFLSSIFVFSSLYSSSESQIGVNVGVSSLKNENGLSFKNSEVGVNYQLNGYLIKPRFELQYSKVSDTSWRGVNSLIKGSVSGVYGFKNNYYWTPYLLAGVGYELVNSPIEGVFESHPFIQSAVGVNYEFLNGMEIYSEAKALQIIAGNDENNEFSLQAGVSFPLNFQNEQKVVATEVIKPIVNKVKIPQEILKEECRVVAPKVIHEKIIEKEYIDSNPCPKKIDAPDVDRDGIEDNLDQCPNTPCSFSVDSFGCPIKTTLKVNFAKNASYLTDYSMPKVVEFANFLIKNKGSNVTIIGHTDNVGNDSKNMLLSQQRAKSIKDKLIELGVSPQRVTAMGRGESEPIATNTTNDGKAQNRRIEAHLSYDR